MAYSDRRPHEGGSLAGKDYLYCPFDTIGGIDLTPLLRGHWPGSRQPTAVHPAA